MTLRVVLYAEGAGEVLGAQSRLPPPGEGLPQAALGPAHILLTRAIEHVRTIPAAAIRFESPLRTHGRLPRGSDLQHEQTLRRLLTWPLPTMRPDLSIVLVDCDVEPSRRARLEGYVANLPGEKVIAVAVQEFEAWLLADRAVLKKVMGGVDRPFLGPVEGLQPAGAKRELGEWIGQARASTTDLRFDLARTVDLAILSREAPSFAALLSSLEAGPRTGTSQAPAGT